MNQLIVFACLAVVALGAPVESPFGYNLEKGIDGSYSFKFATEDGTRTESRTPEGTVSGGYSYVDDNGKTQQVTYKAGEHGVEISGTNLPVGNTQQIMETPEVAAATAEHFELVQKALHLIAEAGAAEAAYLRAHPDAVTKSHTVPAEHSFTAPVHSEELPVPPMDEPEVVMARAFHLAEVARLTQEHLAALAAAPKLVE